MYNLLVVDDEKIIRDGILSVLDQFSCFNKMAAGNGREALEVIEKNQVDGMILDIKMPKMDGLSLLQELEGKQITIPTMILTGYDEFEYAQKALKYGVLDYVLKPVVPEDINLVCQKIKSKLDANRVKEEELIELKSQVEESKSIIKERFFYDILKGKVDEELFIKKAKFLGLPYLGNVFRVVLLEVNLDGHKTEEEYQIELHLAEKILEKQVCQLTGVTLFHLNTDIFVIIFNFKDFTPTSDEVIYRLVESMKADLREELSISITVGLGEICLGVKNIKHSYFQALTALRYKILMGKGYIYNIRDFNHKQNQEIDIAVDIDEIITLLKTGQSDVIAREIRERMDRARASQIKVDLYNLYIICSKYLTAFLSCLKDYGFNLERFFGDKATPFREFLEQKSVDELEGWLLGLLNKTSSQINSYQASKDTLLVNNIKRFIKENYQQNLTNTILAEKMGYSPNYLGQVFKGETGVTINEYVNQTRIKQAKELLVETRLMVYQISDRVGFNDCHYFSSVFKKFTGATPKEYRGLS